MDLTKKQERLLLYLQKMIDRLGRTPSLREAAEDLGVSHNAVSLQLKELERKGFIKRGGRYSRKIEFCNRKGEKMDRMDGRREVPIIGKVTAGLPMHAQQEWDGSVLVDPNLFPNPDLFCLRIMGESMRNAGILDGDLVLCEPRQFASNGEIVVALVHGEEATVKRFFVHNDHIELRPENPDFTPMEYGFAEVFVQGKVVGLLRDRIDGL